MFIEYTIEQFDKWNDVVKRFNNTDIYYKANYVKSLEFNGDGKALLIYYKDGNIEALNVVIKKDLSNYDVLKNNIEKDKYFDYSTPYGYGGFIFKENYGLDIRNKVYVSYKKYCLENNVITEFTRFHPNLENYRNLDNVIDITELGLTITVDTSNYENAWNNYESKNRNVIRKAIRNNVKVEYGFNKDLFNKFKELYLETMDRLGSDKYYMFSNEYFNSLFEDMKDNALIFYATYDGEIISIAYVMLYKDKMHYHLSGTSTKYRNLAATNLLIDQIIKYGSLNGYKTLHLGGGVGAKEDSLFKFKQGFKRDNFTTYKIGKTVFNENKYKEIKEKYKLDNEYFPVYAKR